MGKKGLIISVNLLEREMDAGNNAHKKCTRQKRNLKKLEQNESQEIGQEIMI